MSERDGRYSFVDQEVRRERPTIPVPVPEPTELELIERLERTEQQIALLVGRRERILRKLGRKP